MSEVVMSLRDRVRAKANKDRTQIKIVEFEGEKLGVKQPCGLDYEAVGDKQGIRGTAILLTRITWVCDESGTPVQKLWEPADVDVIVGMPAGDPLLAALLDALKNLSNAEKLQEDAKKST